MVRWNGMSDPPPNERRVDGAKITEMIPAKEWVKEYQDGLPNYNRLLEEGENHPIEVTGRHLRSLMPWIPKKNIKGAQAAYS